MTSRLDRITEQRREKLSRLREMGIEPYPHRYHRSHTTKQVVDMLAGTEVASAGAELNAVSIAGRVMAKRRMGKITFLDF